MPGIGDGHVCQKIRSSGGGIFDWPTGPGYRRLAGYGTIAVKSLCPAIKYADAAIGGYEMHSLPTLYKLPDSISAQAVWISGVMSIVSKGRCFPIEKIQSAPSGGNPEPT
jgi:hypothetical protein